jgi:hypothetical protein
MNIGQPIKKLLHFADKNLLLVELLTLPTLYISSTNPLSNHFSVRHNQVACLFTVYTYFIAKLKSNPHPWRGQPIIPGLFKPTYFGFRSNFNSCFNLFNVGNRGLNHGTNIQFLQCQMVHSQLAPPDGYLVLHWRQHRLSKSQRCARRDLKWAYCLLLYLVSYSDFVSPSVWASSIKSIVSQWIDMILSWNREVEMLRPFWCLAKLLIMKR